MTTQVHGHDAQTREHDATRRAPTAPSDASANGGNGANGAAHDGIEGELARLRRRVRRLETEQAALRSFASAAAHELADPLIVVERTGALLETELGESLDPFLRSRLYSLRRVAAQTRLLTDSLLQDALSAERPPSRSRVELSAVMDDALALVADPGTRSPPRVTVGPMPTVETNRELLTVVVRNLVANAVKYAAPRAGDIRVDATRDPVRWRLSVHSPGDALSGREAARILHRFQRGVNGHAVRGTGLGLAICTRIAERLGGRIAVIPEPGAGNRFVLTVSNAAAAS